MGFYDVVLDELERISRQRFKNAKQFADFVEVTPNLITRWLKKERIPKATSLGEVFDKLNISLVFLEKDQSASRIIEDSGQGLLEKIHNLEIELANKNKEIEELTEYKSKWKGFLEVKEMEAHIMAESKP